MSAFTQSPFEEGSLWVLHCEMFLWFCNLVAKFSINLYYPFTWGQTITYFIPGNNTDISSYYIFSLWIIAMVCKKHVWCFLWHYFKRTWVTILLRIIRIALEQRKHACMAWFWATVTISFSHFSPNTYQNSNSKANGKYFYFFVTKT